MKSIVFANRVGKEIRRDPLSYIFCLGFPVIMLVIMSIIDSSIPAQANMTVFHIENLTPGIAYFGLTFIMLFTSIQVAKDRSTALLLRLYASPMKPIEYMIGYTLPVIVIGMAQLVICFAAGEIIAIVRGTALPIGPILLSIVLLLPSMVLLIGIGILFGCAANEKAAPGLCSIIISAVGMIGGIWMDVDGLGGTIKNVANVLPFYHGVKLARLPFANALSQAPTHLLWTVAFALAFYALAVIVFTSKVRKDIR